VRDSVRDSVWDSVGASVGASAGDGVRDSVRAGVWASVWNSGFGQHDASWLAFYDFFREVLGLSQQTKKLNGLWMIAKSTNWFLPHEKICWVCERPKSLYQDARNGLHHNDKAALIYPDGWALYYLHGVQVPAKYVETPADKLDPVEVLKEPNIEVRMAVINKCGFDRFLGKLEHKQISKSDTSELLDITLNEDLIVRGLLVKWDDKHEKDKHTIIPVPRTREQYAHISNEIPDNIDDAEQVRRWTLGLSPAHKIVMET